MLIHLLRPSSAKDSAAPWTLSPRKATFHLTDSVFVSTIPSTVFQCPFLAHFAVFVYRDKSLHIMRVRSLFRSERAACGNESFRSVNVRSLEADRRIEGDGGSRSWTLLAMIPRRLILTANGSPARKGRSIRIGLADRIEARNFIVQLSTEAAASKFSWPI